MSYSLMSMKMVVLDTNFCTKAMSLNVMNMVFLSKA
ncbi:Uncharacterised protein [Escherichia coli]|uniref:Uncharacterized protein n=1 Tax=Escherichia coli TaxID=562 RepID=A0A377AYC3_ECOLX|nr:Uncharacterised protein [Escherichia coli]